MLWRWLTVREKASPSSFSRRLHHHECVERNREDLCHHDAACAGGGIRVPHGAQLDAGHWPFITGFQALGRMLDAGRAFQAILCSGVNIPMYAVYPIGYRELGRLLMKYATCRRRRCSRLRSSQAC